MSNETIPPNLFKANLELQLRLQRLMQETASNGWRTPRARAKTALPSPARKSKACLRRRTGRNWPRCPHKPSGVSFSTTWAARRR